MKMKQITIALAGVMAAAAFAPEASALPLFARQTGMACNACHFQHFPLLNSFGRSFKASGYTLMGAESKVEGDNLSLPGTLNMAVLTTAGYSKAGGNGTAGKATAAQSNLGVKGLGDGAIYTPATNGEFSLFIGGKVSDFAGALAEVGLLGNNASSVGSTVGVTSAKIPMLWDFNGTRAGVVLFTTNGQGSSYGFETLNTGANAIHISTFEAGTFDQGMNIGTMVSAAQYLGTATAATGAALVAVNDMGFINVTKWHGAGPQDLGGVGAELGSTYVRIAGTFDLGGWDTGVGLQNWSGSSLQITAASPAGVNLTTGAGLAKQDTKATVIDGQMQGEVAGMPLGVYASYGTAPASSATTANTFNANTANSAHALTISADLGVIPEKATIEVGIRQAKNGAAGGADSDNGYLLGATYKLAQNMMAQFTYTSRSGNANNATNLANGITSQTILNLTTLF